MRLRRRGAGGGDPAARATEALRQIVACEDIVKGWRAILETRPGDRDAKLGVQRAARARREWKQELADARRALRRRGRQR